MKNSKVLFLILFLLNSIQSNGQLEPQLLNAINNQALEIPSYNDDDPSELATLGSRSD